MKTNVRVEEQLHVILTLVLDGGEWSASRPDRSTTGKSHRYPFGMRLGGSQSRGSGHEGAEKNSHPLPGLEPPPPQSSSL
jgi:hypothetical protein